MVRERDRYSAYLSCLWCGYVREDMPPLMDEPSDTRDDRGTHIRRRRNGHRGGVTI